MVVLLFSQTVVLGKRLIIIDEYISPTSKKRLKETLRSGDIKYTLEQDIGREDAGADMLGANAGPLEPNEPGMMEVVITRLQGVTVLLFQLDMTNLGALERDFRLYYGKAMISSVNGKKESLETVLPPVTKYGGAVVGLALDEGDIPEDAGRRIHVAKKIYMRAVACGIPPGNVIINGLAMIISTDDNSTSVTLKVLRRVRDELHRHSIPGVNNIPFGLSQHELINSFFSTFAMKSGLSCATINPNSEAMMAAYRFYSALPGFNR